MPVKIEKINPADEGNKAEFFRDKTRLLSAGNNLADNDKGIFMLRRLLILALILIITTTALAQETTPEAEVTPDAGVTAESTEISAADEEMCPTLVANAIDFTQRSCSATGTNEACYGYNFIDAAFRSLDASFFQPGDIENVIDIQSLQLSPLDVQSGQWGVVVMSVEANLNAAIDETPPEDDVQILLYGDTTLSDATQFIEVTAISGVNIREYPRTNSTILGSLESDDILIANGRLPDNSWFRVRLIVDGTTSIGWVSADFLEPGFDADTLPEITVEQAEEAPEDIAAQYGPMQAFIFESGESDAPCSEAPNSGMLIQTPDGVASVTLWLDEVVIQLDGTGVISAQADGELTVGVIEGTAEVEANGESRTALAGQAIDVPLDENLLASDVPGAPRPLDAEEVQALPVDLLNDPVTVPSVGTDPILATASDALQWNFSIVEQPPYICSDDTEVTFQSAGVAAIVSAEADAVVISGVRYTELSDRVYSAVYSDTNGNLFQDTIQITSSDRIIGDRIIDFANPICTITISFVLQFGS